MTSGIGENFHTPFWKRTICHMPSSNIYERIHSSVNKYTPTANLQKKTVVKYTGTDCNNATVVNIVVHKHWLPTSRKTNSPNEFRKCPKPHPLSTRNWKHHANLQSANVNLFKGIHAVRNPQREWKNIAPKFSSNHLSETESGSPIIVTFPATQSDVQRNPKLTIAPPVIHLNLRYLVSEGSKKQHRLETWKTIKTIRQGGHPTFEPDPPYPELPQVRGWVTPLVKGRSFLLRQSNTNTCTGLHAHACWPTLSLARMTTPHQSTYTNFYDVCHEAKPQLTNRPAALHLHSSSAKDMWVSQGLIGQSSHDYW